MVPHSTLNRVILIMEVQNINLLNQNKNIEYDHFSIYSVISFSKQMPSNMRNDYPDVYYIAYLIILFLFL